MSRPAQLCLSAVTFCAFFVAFARPAHARIGLVVGEPFGSFGTMMPQGHASVYIDNLCAASPTQLRPCHPGEFGVVISRYHDLRTRQLDWIAFPAFTFFYGVSNPSQVPTFVTPSLEAELRESYRQAHLIDIVPTRVDKHGIAHPPPYGDWEEGIGAAFDRRLFIYTIATTPAQDASVLAFLNSDPNRRKYTLGRNNCADFAAEVLSIVLPEQRPSVLHRNVAVDFDMTTPKGLARELDAYGHTHPDSGLRVYEVPQIPGTLRRSRPIRGAAESLLTTKRYLATVLVLQPELILTDWIVYESKGRWKPGRDANIITPEQWNNAATNTPALTPATSVALSEADR